MRSVKIGFKRLIDDQAPLNLCNMKNPFFLVLGGHISMFFLALIWPVTVWTQSGTDTLGSLTAEDLVKKAHEFYSRIPDSAIFLAEKAIIQARKEQDPTTEGRAYIEMGLAEMTKGNWLSANEAYRNASVIFIKERDSLALADAWGNLGYSFIAVKEYDNALEYFLKALRIREAYPERPLALAASEGAIGYVYQNIGEYDKAIEQHLKALELRKAFPARAANGIGYVHKNLGINYAAQGKHEQAETEYLIALDTFLSTNNIQFQEEIYRYLGKLYASTGELQKAEQSFYQAMEVADELKAPGTKARSFGALGKTYLEFGENQEAVEWLSKAVKLAEKSGDNAILSETGYQELAKAFSIVGQHDSAYYYSQKFIVLQDTLFDEQSKYKLAKLKTEYETEQIEQELTNIREKEERRVRERNILLVGLGIVFLLVLLSFWVNHQRRKAFSALLEEKNKTDSLLQEKDKILKELREAQSQLIQSEKMASLGQLTAGIAHEINNPINFVTASVEALKLDFQDLQPLLHKILQLKPTNSQALVEEIISMRNQLEAEYLESEIASLIGSIERGASRTKNIVAGLKVFSRNSPEQVIEADLHEGLDATLTILSNKMKDRISVQKNYGDIPLVSCQFDRLNQVFMNIISNAIESIDGEGTISIATKQDGDKVIISIRDNGKGMDSQTLKRVFEPFFTTKEIGKGTGLGLSISYGIIDQHNGKIRLESEPGKGSTFEIILPVNGNISLT